MPPTLTESQVLVWADAHHRWTGEWPIKFSGPVAGVKRLSWNAVDNSLRIGRRGLPGGSSLAQLLEVQRGVRQRAGRPRPSGRSGAGLGR
jgi:hypothetical protein